MDRATGFYPVGWGFESLRAHISPGQKHIWISARPSDDSLNSNGRDADLPGNFLVRNSASTYIVTVMCCGWGSSPGAVPGCMTVCRLPCWIRSTATRTPSSTPLGGVQLDPFGLGCGQTESVIIISLITRPPGLSLRFRRPNPHTPSRLSRVALLRSHLRHRASSRSADRYCPQYRLSLQA